MSLDDSTRQKITDLIEQNRVLLFMKGDRSAPQCGFSARVIEILEGYGAEYETLDVLSNADVREGIKVYSSWPTIPQLYVGGEFIGGCDIITEMHGTGELFEPLGVGLQRRGAPAGQRASCSRGSLPARVADRRRRGYRGSTYGLGPARGDAGRRGEQRQGAVDVRGPPNG